MNYEGDDDHEDAEAIGRDHWQVISTTLNSFIAHKKKTGKSNDRSIYCDINPKILFNPSAWDYIKRRTTDLTSCNIEIPYKGSMRIYIRVGLPCRFPVKFLTDVPGPPWLVQLFPLYQRLLNLAHSICRT